MRKGILRDSSPATKLLLTGTVLFTSFLIFYLLGLLAAKVFYNINLSDLLKSDEESFITQNAPVFKMLQVLQTIGVFIVPALLVGFLVEYNPFRYLQLTRKSASLSYILVPLIMIACVPFINYLASYNAGMHLPSSMKSLEAWMKEGEKSAETLTTVFLKADNLSQLLSNLLLIALLPAIAEEFLFRGLLQKIFVEITGNHHVGIWIAGFLFSFMHFQFFGFLPRMILGVLLGYIFYFSKSLWLPILGHFTNNAMAVIFYYLTTNGKVPKNTEDIGSQPGEIQYAILSLCFAATLLFFLYQAAKKYGQTSSST